jgi:hypothetical protein
MHKQTCEPIKRIPTPFRGVQSKLHSQQPAYLRELLSYYVPGRCFRSSADSTLLDKPRTRTRIADRSFSVAVPTVFNVLRSELRHANTLSNFKTALKTDLYRRAYM